MHRRHLLLLLSPKGKADAHISIPRRIEGWVNLGGWPHTSMVYPLRDGHPCQYKPACLRVTVLIVTNALPLIDSS